MAGGAQDTSDDAITGINVTPLVDITLVLLIIFMVTAKMIVEAQSVPLDLPKAASGTEVQVVFSVVLGANGETLVDGKKVANDEEAPGSARCHQSGCCRFPRPCHPCTRHAEAGRNIQDRLRGHARTSHQEVRRETQ
jgi:hypothetical protein